MDDEILIAGIVFATVCMGASMLFSGVGIFMTVATLFLILSSLGGGYVALQYHFYFKNGEYGYLFSPSPIQFALWIVAMMGIGVYMWVNRLGLA